jgi:hypothetical protein
MTVAKAALRVMMSMIKVRQPLQRHQHRQLLLRNANQLPLLRQLMIWMMTFRSKPVLTEKQTSKPTCGQPFSLFLGKKVGRKWV